MPHKTRILSLFAQRPYIMYGLIFVLCLVLHLIMFRDVVAAIPDVLRGNAAIVREELVPFFNFGSQFWSEGTSELTSSDEVRTAYSFWTAWVRYDQVLPFALILMNALSLFLLFYAFHRIGRYFSQDRPFFGVAAAFLAAFVIYGILLYAKIAHFYVLIIGFSLFALAASLMIEQIFFKKELQWRNALAVLLLVLFNPAIHYHVIFYLLFIVIVSVHLLFNFTLNRGFFGYYLKKNILYFAVVTFGSLIPYALLIFATTHSSLSSVSTDIPVNYWMIFYTSLPLQFIFSFDTAGHLDLLRYGNYLAPLPRFGSMVVTGLIGSLFLFWQWGKVSILKKVLLLTLFISMLVAMWMSIGYSPNTAFSFHAMLSGIALWLADQGGAVAETVGKGITIFINILRFPHRFQFIYFYLGGLLFMVVLMWLKAVLDGKIAKKWLTATLVVLIALFPIVASADYRTALASGDVATFVAPYKIPDDLKQIKAQLEARQDDKLFILPTLESGREIVKDGQRYSFLDKFLIYYLNQPTFYYGVGSNTQNKLLAYLVYRAISYNEPWWEDVLVHNLGITHIVKPKHIEPRARGITYLPGIDKAIDERLANSKNFHPVLEGDDFVLYEVNKGTDTTKRTMVDLQWRNFLNRMRDNKLANQAFSFPLQLDSFTKQQAEQQLFSDNPERSFYNFYAQLTPNSTFYPNPASLPFSPDLVASSNFTNNALSLSTLYSKGDAYNYLHEEIPSLVGLRTPSFVGLTKGNGRLALEFTVPADGEYRLLLHGGARTEEVEAELGGQLATLQKIAGDRVSDAGYIDFSYFMADVKLRAGKHTLKIKNATENALVAESLTLLPTRDVPADFNNIDTPQLSIQSTGQAEFFNVTIKGAKK